MKPRKKSDFAKSSTVKITVNKDLDKYTEINLFPEKLERANYILSKAKFTYIKGK
jgi:hypothetical protein